MAIAKSVALKSESNALRPAQPIALTLLLIDELTAAAEQGVGQVAILSGPTGIGKSSVMEHMAFSLAEQGRFTLRVGDDLGLGVPTFQLDEFSLGEGLVHDAGALPQDNVIATALLGDIASQMAIGGEYDLLIAQGFDDFRRIR